ncbi:MAG: hypothetical protein ABI867_17020 [Kofleriaceae bacterium]
MTVPRALLLILALLQATGIADLIRREACAAECSDDGCGDDCAPGSDCPCHCPTSPSIAAPTEVVVKLGNPEPAAIVFERNERAHASPDPREILHVPRRLDG